MDWCDATDLFSYWRENPPAHECLKNVFGLKIKESPAPVVASPIVASKNDPSGIAGLIMRFPNGYVSEVR
jgi:hypothetical protein